LPEFAFVGMSLLNQQHKLDFGLNVLNKIWFLWLNLPTDCLQVFF